MKVIIEQLSQALEIRVSRALGFLLEEAGGYRAVRLAGDFPVRTGVSLWLLPVDLSNTEKALQIVSPDAPVTVEGGQEWKITVASKAARVIEHANRPRCDLLGAGWSLGFEGGDKWAQTMANFYWDSLLPMTVEFKPGFVLSTLQKDSYGGTYPAVDHEFQIKGRLALGGAVERDVVRRMMELQLQLMRDHPEGVWRAPCALQQNGDVEYHVTRKSWDRQTEAIMFFITGNTEFLEELWLYACITKDRAWVAGIIDDVEQVAGHVERQIDAEGRLWGDVYYEDQVMKDGRESFAQALASWSFAKLAEVEDWLGRADRAVHWRSLSQRLAEVLVRPLPVGYWDQANSRFVDWIDRAGAVHDHLHLLAAELPVLIGAATKEQAVAVRNLLDEHEGVFQKFPSFVAAKIEDYTDAEIGDGGPYDLCAAGRYWCWDAAYWASLRDGRRLAAQLEAVSAQAARDGWLMGERYDMNYVYYPSDKNWHGAAHYYEYPNVFARVLFCEYLGFLPDLKTDGVIRPLLVGQGEVRVETAGVQWAYLLTDSDFSLTNLAVRERTVVLDLGKPQKVTLAAGETRRFDRQAQR